MEGGRTIGRPLATKSWPGETDAIRQGNVKNKIVVEGNGTDRSLTVNGALIGQAENDTYSSGSIGPTATSHKPASSEIHFDNLVMTAP